MIRPSSNVDGSFARVKVNPLIVVQQNLSPYMVGPIDNPSGFVTETREHPVQEHGVFAASSLAFVEHGLSLVESRKTSK